MARSDEFGHQMERESRRRRFDEVGRRLFYLLAMDWLGIGPFGKNIFLNSHRTLISFTPCSISTPPKLGEKWIPLADAARYFHNNHQRMDYPRYRREGLPITSSPTDSGEEAKS